MSREQILAKLNSEQAQAAGKFTGPILVLAGAGTGKTRVITYRIACMLDQGIMPRQILGLTFTNKAAREMRERLATLVPKNSADKVTLGTFHSFCMRLLRAEAPKIGFLREFTIADDADRTGIFKQAVGMCGYGGSVPVAPAMAQMDRWKNHLKTPEQALKTAESDLEVMHAHIYEKYRDLLEMQNIVDFDDMLLLAYRIFTEHPEVLEKYRNHYHYLLVDEYQDTNYAQFELVRLLAEPENNLCVVGDDDQSIYSWRGADVGNILDFPQLYPNALVVKLEQNYRSTGAILNAANAVIGVGVKRHEKRLWSGLGEGKKPQLLVFENENMEAKFAADIIASRKSENSELHYRDFAILYRSNLLSLPFETALRTNHIPYRVVGGQDFFQRREVKDAVAYLRLLSNPHDDQSVLRILQAPPRGVGEKAVNLLKEQRMNANQPMMKTLNDPNFLNQLSKKGAAAVKELNDIFLRGKESFSTPGSLVAKMRTFLSEAGYLDGLQKIYRDIKDSENRRENLESFFDAVYRHEQEHPNVTLVDYLESFALLEENDRTATSEQNDDAVTLSSVHAAKGLEYPVVILPALEQGWFPHERALEEHAGEEERRLFYVAITRAKQELYLTRSRRRQHRGMNMTTRPSEFLADLPAELVDRATADDLISLVKTDDLVKNFEEMIKELMNPDN